MRVCVGDSFHILQSRGILYQFYSEVSLAKSFKLVRHLDVDFKSLDHIRVLVLDSIHKDLLWS